MGAEACHWPPSLLSQPLVFTEPSPTHHTAPLPRVTAFTWLSLSGVSKCSSDSSPLWAGHSGLGREVLPEAGGRLWVWGQQIPCCLGKGRAWDQTKVAAQSTFQIPWGPLIWAVGAHSHHFTRTVLLRRPFLPLTLEKFYLFFQTSSRGAVSPKNFHQMELGSSTRQMSYLGLFIIGPF